MSVLKSQVSVEYMLVMGFATLMTIPLLLIYYTYTSDSSDSVATGQALQIARNNGHCSGFCCKYKRQPANNTGHTRDNN